jgi:hypothetical protein
MVAASTKAHGICGVRNDPAHGSEQAFDIRYLLIRFTCAPLGPVKPHDIALNQLNYTANDVKTQVPAGLICH